MFIVIAGAFIATATLSPAHAADAEKDKKLFESATLGDGTTGNSCVTCHADGAKFGADLFERKEYIIMGMKLKSVADIVNICIEKPLGGKAIDTKGDEMADILAYMQSLLKPAAK